jgi:hypothetical protein
VGIALATLAGVTVLVALVSEVFVESVAAGGHDAWNFTRVCRLHHCNAICEDRASIGPSTHEADKLSGRSLQVIDRQGVRRLCLALAIPADAFFRRLVFVARKK